MANAFYFNIISTSQNKCSIFVSQGRGRESVFTSYAPCSGSSKPLYPMDKKPPETDLASAHPLLCSLYREHRQLSGSVSLCQGLCMSVLEKDEAKQYARATAGKNSWVRYYSTERCLPHWFHRANSCMHFHFH